MPDNVCIEFDNKKYYSLWELYKNEKTYKLLINSSNKDDIIICTIDNGILTIVQNPELLIEIIGEIRNNFIIISE